MPSLLFLDGTALGRDDRLRSQMCELIVVQFGDRPTITRREYLLSVERNVRLAIEQPELSSPALKMAGRRLEQAIAAQKAQQGGVR